jgi:hypothetical protein
LPCLSRWPEIQSPGESIIHKQQRCRYSRVESRGDRSKVLVLRSPKINLLLEHVKRLQERLLWLCTTQRIFPIDNEKWHTATDSTSLDFLFSISVCTMADKLYPLQLVATFHGKSGELDAPHARTCMWIMQKGGVSDCHRLQSCISRFRPMNGCMQHDRASHGHDRANRSFSNTVVMMSANSGKSHDLFKHGKLGRVFLRGEGGCIVGKVRLNDDAMIATHVLISVFCLQLFKRSQVNFITQFERANSWTSLPSGRA